MHSFLFCLALSAAPAPSAASRSLRSAGSLHGCATRDWLPFLAHPTLRSRRPAKSRNPRPKSRNPPPLWKEIASGPPLRPNSRSASSYAFAAPWLSVLRARALDPRHRAPVRPRTPPRAIPAPSPRSTRLRQSRPRRPEIAQTHHYRALALDTRLTRLGSPAPSYPRPRLPGPHRAPAPSRR